MSHMDLRARGKRPSCADCRLCNGTMLNWFGHQPADILFLVDFPRHEDVQRGPFQSGAGQTFFKLVNIVRQKLGGEDSPIARLRLCAGYALQCGFSDPESKIKAYPSDAELCGFRNERLAMVRPRLIVPMGKLATQALGIKVDNFNKIRGRLTETTIQGQSYKVFPTFHPAAVYLGGGLTNLFESELRKILETGSCGTQAQVANLKKEIANYKYPDTWEEVRDLSERILTETPVDKPICLDTETNTLRIHLDESTGKFARRDEYGKCIAFSVAWGRRKSAAWLMNHKELTGKDAEEWWRRMPFVFNLLMSPHPKLAHNFQFDLRVFRHLSRMVEWRCNKDLAYKTWFEQRCHYPVIEIVDAMGIRNPKWDSMLLEHALEEDKKGYYGLKACTRKYEPAFGGYEESLRSDEAGEVVRLNSLKDYTEYLEGTDEFRELRERLTLFEARVNFLSDAAPSATPERFLRVINNKGAVRMQDVWPLIVREARPLMTKVGKWVKGHFGEGDKSQKKEVWALYQKSEAYRKSAQEHPKFPVEFKDLDWYLWFKKEYKKDLVKPLVKAKAAELKEAFEKEREEINFEDFDTEELLVYAAIDTDMSYCALEKQLILLAREEEEKPSIDYMNCADPSSVSANQLVSMPVCVALSQMVDNGVAIDFNYLEDLDQTYLRQAEEMKDKIFEIAEVGVDGLNGKTVNLNSTEHIAEMLVRSGYEKFLTERTPTGKIRVTKGVLKSISKGIGTGKNDLDLCKAILCYRESLKASKTFLKNFRNMAAWDGRVHPSFHQIGTATYRLSSSGPNFQNIPLYLAGHNLKKCVVPSHPDWCIVNIDASGAEVKTLTAYLAQMQGEHRGQQLIYEMNNDPDFDMHSKFCSYIFGPELFDFDVSTPEKWDQAYHWVRANKEDNKEVKNARKKTKAVVFGTLYGQTKHGLSYLLGISLEEAEFIITQFFSADPSIGAYVNWSQAFVQYAGYITTILGRRRRFPLAGLDRRQLSRAKRQATNFLIQSLTVDIFNCLLSQFIPILANRLGGRPLLQVHDALVMEMPKSKLLLAKDLMQEHFEDKAASLFPFFPVRFKCDMEAGDNYGEVMPIDKYLKQCQEEGGGGLFLDEDMRDAADVRLRLAESDPDEAHLVEDVMLEAVGDEISIAL